jgi:anti-sigma-K factor RskA
VNEDLHQLSGAYVLDAVDDDERRAFEEHLTQCPACTQEVAELRGVVALLGEAAHEAPPPAMRDAVLSAIGSTEQLPAVEAHPDLRAINGEPAARGGGAGPGAARRAPRWLWAAAAVLLVALGLVAWGPWRDHGNGFDRAAAAVIDAPDAQRYEQPMDGHTATLVVSHDQNRAVVLADGMPAAPAGHTFQLWFQRPGQGMVPAGLLDGGGTTKATVLDGSLGDATAVGITLEPAGGSPAPTTEPLVVFEM